MRIKTRLTRPRTLATLVVAAAVLVPAFAVTRGGDGDVVWASFERVNGVVEGSHVQAGGVDVGTVTAVDLARDGYPRVRLHLDRDFHLNRGATAAVRFFSVGGEANRVIDVTQGAGPRLPDGATIARSRTDVPEEIDQVLSTLDPGTRTEVHRLFTALDRSTRGRGADIAAALRRGPDALRETARAVAALDADGAALRRLVRSGRTVVSALAADPGAVTGAVDRLGDLLGTTGREQRALQATLVATTPALAAAERAFARLRRSVRPLRGFVADARPGLRTLADTAPDLDRTLTAARPALAQLRGLVGQRHDVDRVGALLDVARPALKELRPTLEDALPAIGEVRARYPDAFAFLSNWADFHATYDAVGHSGRVGLIFTPTPTNSIAGDGNGPGEIRQPFVRLPGALADEPWSDYERTLPREGER